MQDLTSSLKKALEGANRIAVLGVGSELRADDWVGMAAAQEIEKSTALSNIQLKVFFGETAPENLTGEIKKFEPSHLIIVDCGDIGEEPGEAVLIDPDQEIFGASFSTHKLPIKVLVEYLNRSFPVRVSIIVIQPKTIEFGKPMTTELMLSAKEVSTALMNALKG